MLATTPTTFRIFAEAQGVAGQMSLCAAGDGQVVFSSSPLDCDLMGPGRDATRSQAVERITETALAALYQKYAPAIYAHCRRLLQSQAAARDATQEAFVRVLTRGPSFPNDDDALRYLYRVSTNVCLNQIREFKVHTRAAASLRTRPAWSGSMEAQHVDREFVAAVLERCGEAGATVAIMHYVDGMSQVEIAGILGITRRTVFNRLRKLTRIAHDLLGASPIEGATKEDGKP
jgi:RNA polymerase sigma-70 factor (ECF subfamily)